MVNCCEQNDSNQAFEGCMKMFFQVYDTENKALIQKTYEVCDAGNTLDLDNGQITFGFCTEKNKAV